MADEKPQQPKFQVDLEQKPSTLDEIEELLAEEPTPTRPWIVTTAWVLSAVFHCTLLIILAKVILSKASDGTEGGYVGIPIEPAAEMLAKQPDQLKAEDRGGMTLELEDIPTANMTIAAPTLGGKSFSLKAAPPARRVSLEFNRRRGHIRKLLFPKRALLTRGSKFFGAKAKGRKFVYIVDRSRSMARLTSVRIEGEGTALYRGTYLRIAKRELLRSIRALEPGARFHVIFFADFGETLQMPGEKLEWATEENRARCAEWLRTVDYGTGTEPLDALKRALKLKPDAIFLLCDGEFDTSVVRDIAKFNRASGIPIHTLAFVDRKGEAVLQDLAAQNGGRYRYVPPDTHAGSVRGRGRDIGRKLNE